MPQIDADELRGQAQGRGGDEPVHGPEPGRHGQVSVPTAPEAELAAPRRRRRRRASSGCARSGRATTSGIVETLFTARRARRTAAASAAAYEHLAARFAAKEAVLKAFGTGIGQRMRWTDVEVVNERSGRPTVAPARRGRRLRGAARPARPRRLALPHRGHRRRPGASTVWHAAPLGAGARRALPPDRPGRRVRAGEVGPGAQGHLAAARTTGRRSTASCVMPPPFVLEALCQAGTWLIMITTDRRKRAALLSVGSVDFLGDVRARRRARARGHGRLDERRGRGGLGPRHRRRTSRCWRRRTSCAR